MRLNLVLLFFLIMGVSIMKGLYLKSTSFDAGQLMDKRFTCDDDNFSPELEWGNFPEGTQSFALICDDPDAPQDKPWVHWVVSYIPTDLFSFGEGIKRDDQNIIQGTNSFKRVGYDGPCPPQGDEPHRYFFKIYALDTKLNLDSSATKEDLLKAMENRVISSAELMGKYQKSGSR